MKNHSRSIIALIAFLAPSAAFAESAAAAGSKAAAQPSPSSAPAVLASNTWTAAFAELAGLDDVDALAPANLTHPPEYELTVSDIKKVSKAQYLICAGYERMMATIASSGGAVELVKITTQNDLATVMASVNQIAAVTGTEGASAPRLKAYAAAIEEGRALVKSAGVADKKAYVHVMQLPLAKDLGLTVGGTFGPGPVTAVQIAEAKTGAYDLIIDNVHNPVAKPLAETAPAARVLVWRNFPETLGSAALENMVRANIETLFVD